MSNLNTILVILGLGLGNIFLWWFVDQILWQRLDAVASGVVRGIAMSKEYRRVALWFYSMYVGGAIGGHAALGVFWLVAAQNAAAQEVKVILYVAAWVALAAVAAWTATGIVWHRHFAALLREGEVE
jgi:hypothetical protein